MEAFKALTKFRIHSSNKVNNLTTVVMRTHQIFSKATVLELEEDSLEMARFSTIILILLISKMVLARVIRTHFPMHLILSQPKIKTQQMIVVIS